MTNIQNSHPTDELDLDIALKLRQLQQNLRLLPQQKPFEQPHFVLMEQAIKLPTGFLVPAVRNHQQKIRPRHLHSPNNSPRHSHNPNKDNLRHSHNPNKDNLRHSHNPNDSPNHSNYNPSSNNHLHKSASALTPVTIKILPLKLTSIEIANALKSVSFMPIPLDFLNIKGNGGGSDFEDKPTYNDRDESQPEEGWNDEEEDLPPPSSHVATPQDKPLGITYAEGRRSERYINRYHPRK
ncbi:uncharacterized protein LOC118191205 [Stegodyphus dumicola]|uniref:uncharacterized protein LOC118191205 n=1 Tax=Stegodyphus dumicola TaxID=202533 RepID=UPI0015AB2CC0|nr:uncharacterized protein LOC118191205 [Stegodyphus dumicola]